MIAAAGDRGHDLTLELYLTTVGLSTEATRTVLGEHFGKAFALGGFRTAASRQFHETTASQLRLKARVIELLNAFDGIALPRAVALSSCREDVSVTSLRVVCSTDSKLSLRRATMRTASQILISF
jgi:hypothetical protein